MLPNKFQLLIDRLSEKTERSELHWERTSEEGKYQLVFPSYSIVISPEPTQLHIYNSGGELVESVSVTDLGTSGFTDARKKLQGLYSLARRQVMGVDEAIDVLLADLG